MVTVGSTDCRLELEQQLAVPWQEDRVDVTPAQRPHGVRGEVPHREQVRLDEVVVARLRAGMQDAVHRLEREDRIDEALLLVGRESLDVLAYAHGRSLPCWNERMEARSLGVEQ